MKIDACMILGLSFFLATNGPEQTGAVFKPMDDNPQVIPPPEPTLGFCVQDGCAGRTVTTRSNGGCVDLSWNTSMNRANPKVLLSTEARLMQSEKLGTINCSQFKRNDLDGCICCKKGLYFILI